MGERINCWSGNFVAQVFEDLPLDRQNLPYSDPIAAKSKNSYFQTEGIWKEIVTMCFFFLELPSATLFAHMLNENIPFKLRA